MNSWLRNTAIVCALGLVITGATAAQPCLDHLGDGSTYLKGEVVDIGRPSKLPEDQHRWRIKFKSFPWVVTCRYHRSSARTLVRGAAVEFKQHGEYLRVRSKQGERTFRIVCIQKIVYVE